MGKFGGRGVLEVVLNDGGPIGFGEEGLVGMDLGFAKHWAIGTGIKVQAGDAEVGRHAAEGVVGPGIAGEQLGFGEEMAALAELAGEDFAAGGSIGGLGGGEEGQAGEEGDVQEAGQGEMGVGGGGVVHGVGRVWGRSRVRRVDPEVAGR